MKIKAKDKIIITKVEESKKNSSGINLGFYKIGYLLNDIKVGQSIVVVNELKLFMSSPVTDIVNENIIKTVNSTYKIEFYEDN